MFIHPNTYVRAEAIAHHKAGKASKMTEDEAKAFTASWKGFWDKELQKLWMLIGALMLFACVISLL